MTWLDEIVREGEHATRLRNDLEYFAGNVLQIRPKSGSLEPFRFNAAQRKLHAIIEKQKRETGRVRVVVLKARQMGISTYIGARLFHRTINHPGLRTIIVAHERKASSGLFQIVKRYYDNLPEDIRPSLGTCNSEELIFDKIDSGYIVSVASEDGAGRSATPQMLHASEAAFWVKFLSQMAALQVPDMDGTEIIIETTANGYNEFHEFWRKAEAGQSEFIPVFLPWSLDPGYVRALPEDFQMTGEERALAELHSLSPEQIYWRRIRIQSGNEELFAQEFPLTPQEAFIAAQFDSFIAPESVLKARRTTDIEPYGPLIIGVDPAGKGADRSAIAWRRGHCVTKIETRRGLDTMELSGWVNKIIRDDKPDRVNIDVGGLGVGVYDRLIELGHSRSLVNAVNFGGKPTEPPPLDERGNPAGGPANRRAEMWANLKQALAGRLSLPDRESLQGDLTSVGYKFTSDGRLLLESKEDMKRRGLPSPDEGDAVALCFSEPGGSPIVRSAKFNRELVYEGSYV